MPNRYMHRWSTAPTLRQMQIKTTERCQFVFVRKSILKKKRDKKSFEVDLLHFVLSLLPISFRKPQRAVYLFKEWRLNRPLEG